MDFEAWRCCHDETLFCPDEGCSKADGCARDCGWKPDDRRPLPPWLLLEAEQDRPDIPAKARVAKPVKPVRTLKWMAGTVIVVALAVAGISLQRSFVLTDRVADVRVDTSTIRVIAEKDISAIRSQVEAMRADLERVGDAVGAKLPENRAELSPQRSIQ